MNQILNQPVLFPCGAAMKNQFMLAPMTNTQSHEDGTLSDEEFQWLVMRAKGGFGLVMTCAAHVQAIGKGFPGQLGIFSDSHIPGHQRLSKALKDEGCLAVIQLHHAGMRSPGKIINTLPVCSSKNEKHGARALSYAEVVELRNDFIQAAIRAKQSGYDGVEVHGAHGYVITQFLSAEINQREDEYGGNLQNRSRLLFEIVDGIREACGRKFLLGVRISPERFGMDLIEAKTICQRLISESQIDFLDISLWDCFKLPNDDRYQNQSLLEHFTQLELGDVRLTVAGKIGSGADVIKVLDAGVDFVTIGRAAILHHDFPIRLMNNPDFVQVKTPVSKDYLRSEGLGEKFIQYMLKRPNFVDEHSE